VPFCALKIGPLSCFCLSLPRQSDDRPRRYHDDDDLLEVSEEEDENEFLVRSVRPERQECRSLPQPPLVRRPSAAALELSRQLSRRDSKNALGSRVGSKDMAGSGSLSMYSTGSLNLDGNSKRSSGNLGRAGALPPVVRWMGDSEAAGGDASAAAQGQGQIGDDHGRDGFQSGELGVVDETDEEEPEMADPAEVEEVQAFNKAIRCGKFLEARRELDRLRAASIDPSEILGEVPVERVGRIASKFDISLKMFEARMEDFSVFERNDKIGVKWGFDLQGPILKIIFEVSFAEMDVVRAFAAVQERDLHKPFNAGLESAKTHGEETPHDSIWQSFTFSKTTNTKGDNLTHISGLDALDEPPLSSLWAGHYNITEEAAAVAGFKVPPPQEGHTRSSYAFTAYSLAPTVPRGGGDRSRGVRMKVLTETKLPAMISSVLSVMPSFVLRRLARSRVEAVPMQFKDFVLTSQHLDDRLVHGPRREFYAMLRERLVEG